MTTIRGLVLVYLRADGQPVDPSAWFQEDPYRPVLKERQANGEGKIIPWASVEREIDPDWRKRESAPR